jgi:hypothetical protein
MRFKKNEYPGVAHEPVELFHFISFLQLHLQQVHMAYTKKILYIKKRVYFKLLRLVLNSVVEPYIFFRFRF